MSGRKSDSKFSYSQYLKKEDTFVFSLVKKETTGRIEEIKGEERQVQ